MLFDVGYTQMYIAPLLDIAPTTRKSKTKFTGKNERQMQIAQHILSNIKVNKLNLNVASPEDVDATKLQILLNCSFRLIFFRIMVLFLCP